MKNIRKSLLACVAALSMGSLAGCDFFTKPLDFNEDTNQKEDEKEQQEEVDVESVSVASDTISLLVGETADISYTVLPENATNKAVTFTSTATKYATVDANGKVTAVAQGQATIIVQSVADPSKMATVEVNVSTLHIGVESVTVSPSSLDLVVGAENDLTVTVLPENATNKNVSFSSLNSNVASVNAEGHVIAANAGNTYIQVQCEDDLSKSVNVPVTVSPAYVAVEEVEVSTESLALVAGETTKIYANVLPENATVKDLTFTSSDTSKATVAADGTVTAVENGSATIRVEAVDNSAIYKNVSVTIANEVVHVTSVNITEETVNIEENDSAVQLHATVLPDNADNKGIQWTSSNPSVAGVSQTGLVTPIAKGTTTITATTADGGYTDTCTINVTRTDVASFSINKPTLLFEISDNASMDVLEETLEVTISPNDATYQEVEWTSSNPSVASITPNGKECTVTRGSVEGQTIINASIKHTTQLVSCLVTVKNVEVTAIALDHDSISFSTEDSGEDAKRTLVATLTPDNSPDKDIIWTSSDISVATVANGVVTKVATSEATAIITAEHVRSHKTAACIVSVVEAEDLIPTLPINTNKAYQTYNNNKKANPSNTLAEFADRTQMYEVGDDNKVNLRPEFTLLDGNNNIIDQGAWSYPFTFDIQRWNGSAYVTASTSDYDVINAKSCDIHFHPANMEVENIYKVSITLGGLSPEEIATAGSEAVAVYEVKVVDGYNVTNEYEFAYLDSSKSTAAETGVSAWKFEMGMGADIYTVDFPAFKAAHGLSTSLNPSTLVLHKDMVITKDHVPAENFCSEADAEAGNWDASERQKAIGSIKDDAFLYRKFTSGKTTISGNYFTLDWSKIPLVKRTRGKNTSLSDKVESHAGFFRTWAGEFEIKNINFIGNAHAATSSADEAFAGGLIGFKIRGTTTLFKANNTLGHGCYITYMNEGAASELANGKAALLDIYNTKLFDNYNCFIYNWGGSVQAEKSFFEGCGGPCVIQDHVKASGKDNYEEFEIDGTPRYKFKYVGTVSDTTFIDCTINNYVIGQEAWFVSFHADALTDTIKQLCDLVAGVNGTRSAIYDSNHNVSTYAGLAGQDSLFNFIVLNKSGSAEGITNDQVNGRVTFKHRVGENLTVVDDFNYQNPALTGDAYSQDMAQLMQAQTFAKFRTVGGTYGAPIFETAGGLGYWPGEGNKLLDVNSAGGTPAYVSNDFCTNAGENLALYYNGMMLVMSLGTFGA